MKKFIIVLSLTFLSITLIGCSTNTSSDADEPVSSDNTEETLNSPNTDYSSVKERLISLGFETDNDDLYFKSEEVSFEDLGEASMIFFDFGIDSFSISMKDGDKVYFLDWSNKTVSLENDNGEYCIYDLNSSEWLSGTGETSLELTALRVYSAYLDYCYDNKIYI